MKLLLNTEFNLYEKDGKAFCDSLHVADDFSKEHKNVLRDIENLDCSEKFGKLNFELSSYKSAQNKKMPKYLLTKDGFIFLVMGYRGKIAARFKEAYIERFNQMEEYILSLHQLKADYPAFTKAITQAHEVPAKHHYSNEINMINKIVLGMNAKQFKEANGINSKVSSIRPYLSSDELKLIEELQVVDIGLIVSGMEYQQRRERLEQYYNRQQLLGIA